LPDTCSSFRTNLQHMDNRERINNIDELVSVPFDFDTNEISEKTKKLKPQVFKDLDTYCAIYGPDPVVGIFGCGDTPLAAIKDWEKDLEERIERLTEGDHAAVHAKANM
jgi:hypothetical protein